MAHIHSKIKERKSEKGEREEGRKYSLSQLRAGLHEEEIRSVRERMELEEGGGGGGSVGT